jgi:acetate kinase
MFMNRIENLAFGDIETVSAATQASIPSKQMHQAILVLNAGSSSIKFSLLRWHDISGKNGLLCSGQLSGIGEKTRFSAKDGAAKKLAEQTLPQGSSHEEALEILLNWIDRHYAEQKLIAAGHRVVHGGALYTAPILIDSKVIEELRRLIPLAPLHQPHHIAAIEAMQKLHPTLPQVACFDTAFHHTQATVVTHFALPRSLTEEGIRRYGFHGLSYEYVAGAASRVMGQELSGGRVIVAHLGSGASMCAMRHGKSIATTMGFTALDGLPMSRRCGNLDPGVILYLMQEKGLNAKAVSNLLYHDCGLFGVSGISDDMQTLLASDEPHAAEAVDLFVYRIGRELGSLSAALGGLDALVFTGGIGEHAAELRRRVCADAAWLGVEIEASANADGGPCLSPPGSKVSAWVIPTDEDLMIAQHTQQVLAPGRPDDDTSSGDDMHFLER